MPGKVKVRILSGRSLPVMDRSNDTTDAYVEVKLGQVTHKTDVCRKSLNPLWNSEWFKFEMDDLELQDEPLQIRLMDYDTYSANDAIGKVYLDLNPLLINPSKAKENWGKTISGWIPVYDTMHGIRGEVNLVVKVELFSDLNKYRQSSCGVRFFFSPQIPEGFIAHSVNGFVEELVINDDPEYQWIDKIRTPRASNEARQTLFQKLSGEVQRRVGLKALELGGNAVVGYKQSLDLEGESGIVIRGIGTAMYLTKMYENQLSPGPQTSNDGLIHSIAPAKESHQSKSPLQQRSFHRLSPNPFSTPSMLSRGADMPDCTTAPCKPQKSFSYSYSHTYTNVDGEDNCLTLSNLIKMTKKLDKHAVTKGCDVASDRSHNPVPLKPSTSTKTNEYKNTQVENLEHTHALSLRKYSEEISTSASASEATYSPGLAAEPELDFVEDALSEIIEEPESSASTPLQPHNPPPPLLSRTPLKLSAMPLTLFETKDASDSVSEDSPATSPSSSVKKFTFSLRKKRWLSRRQRLSTNCLLKRASSSSSTGSKPAKKFSHELGKLFKKISFSAGEGDSDSNQPKQDTQTIYRQPKSSFFRKRRKSRSSRRNSRQLFRSSSDSWKHHTSSESLPSVGSEPPSFHLEEEEFGGEETYTSLAEMLPPNLRSPVNNNAAVAQVPSSKDKPATEERSNTATPKQVSLDPKKLRELVQQLGYDTGKPLKLYISSLDALLVYDPPKDAVNSSCVCLNVDEVDNRNAAATGAEVALTLDNVDVQSLLNLKRNDESSLGLVEEGSSVNRKGSRNNTIVECNSNTGSSSSSNTSSTSSVVSSSSCTKMGLFLVKGKLKRSDEDEVEEDEGIRVLHENLTRRSPIPEEFENCGSAGNATLPTSATTTSETFANVICTAASATKTNNGVAHERHDDGGLESPDKPSGSTKYSKGMDTPKSMQGYNLIHRRSSESDLSTTPKGKAVIYRPIAGINCEQLRMQEFPFFTLSQLPEGFISYLGGTVTARSVKLLDRIGNFEEPDPESRDAWWNEIRVEMRSHCRAFGCTVVLGYEEQTTMCDEVCIMSASGTAAIIVSSNTDLLEGDGTLKEHRRHDSFTGTTSQTSQLPCGNGGKLSPKTVRRRHESDDLDFQCGMLHIPHSAASLPTIVKKSRCAYCKKGKVPDVLLSTIEIPSGLHTTGRSCLVQTQVFRSKKDYKGEASAKEMSDSLPFLEYELHRRLINKLKVKGMNAIFGVQVTISQGEKLMVGIATGTAVFLTALPIPSVPIISAGNSKTDAQKVLQFQKVVQETFERNRDVFGVRNILVPQERPHTTGANGNSGSNSGTGANSISDEESDDEIDVEIINRNKDTFVLEVDDAEDIDIITMITNPTPPIGYNMSNIQTMVGFEGHRVISQQMFNQVWRCKIPSLSLRQLTIYFDRLIRSITFKLRRNHPCILSKLSFKCDLPEQDEMQLCIIGMALGLDKKASHTSLQNLTQSQLSTKPFTKQEEDNEMMFMFDEDKEKASGQYPPVFGDSSTTPPQSANQLQSKSSAVASNVGPSVASKLSSSSSPSHGAISFNVQSQQGHVSSRFTTQSDSTTSAANSTTSNIASTNENDGGKLANLYSVRHPHSNRSTRLMSFSKPMPLPVSKMKHWVEITPLSSIPGAKIERYLGNLNFFFIRETTSLRETGGLSGFVHNCFTEVLAIVRAHVSALGGNAMVAYFMTECALLHNPHKNQSQCVINVGGDAVFVQYPMTE